MNRDENGTEPTAASLVYGIAALSLLEAVILTLQSRGLLTTDEIDEAFDAAISAHQHSHESHTKIENEMAASILNRLRVEGNSVRLDFR